MSLSIQPTTEATPEVLPEALLRNVARLALRRLAEDRPDLRPQADAEAWIQRATQILAAHIASGRIELARQFQPAGLAADASLLSYAGQILVELLTESERIAALTRGDTVVWQPVIRRMERLAYAWFGPSGREDWAACEAREVAAHTCTDLWAWLQNHPYPFDVPFDRWAVSALYRRLRWHARRRSREERQMVRVVDSMLAAAPLRHGEPLGVCFADYSVDEWFEQAANREALLQAMACLDERDALVLRLWYLEQWPADEIAARLGVHVGNVYVLRFRALEKLRRIVTQDVRLGLAQALTLIDSESQRLRPIPSLGENTA